MFVCVFTWAYIFPSKLIFPPQNATRSPPFSFPVILILFYFLTLFSKPFQQLTSSSEYLNYLVQVGQVKIATNQSQMFSGLFAHLDLG